MNIKSIYRLAVLIIGLIFQSYMASAQVKVIQNGNVGIGTDNPEEKLVVDGKTILKADLTRLDIVPHLNIVEDKISTYSGRFQNHALSMSFGQSKVATMGIVGTATNGIPQSDSYFYLGMGSDDDDVVHNAPDIIVDNDGNVGIGLVRFPILDEKLTVARGIKIINTSGTSGLTVSRVGTNVYPQLNIQVDQSRSKLRSHGNMTFWTAPLGSDDYKESIVINTLGDVGIGIATPNGQFTNQSFDGPGLHLGGGAENFIRWQQSIPGGRSFGLGISADDRNLHLIGQAGGAGATNKIITFTSGGNVGIGTTDDPQERLEVVGNVQATSFISATMSYPDYVFQNYFSSLTSINPNHRLMPLSKLRDYISTHHHLPGIPSLQDVMDNDMNIDVGETAVKNLEKIEELTLYAIEANEKIITLQEENTSLIEQQKVLKKMIDQLNTRILKLESNDEQE